jgi:predicted O-linked N-acetylglucosamine transferase (SPINDLY family)
VALELQRSGRVAEAEFALRQLLLVSPQHAQGLLGLHALLVQTGRAQQAASLLDQASAHAPNNASCLCALGGAYLSVQRRREAVAVFRRAAALQPDLVEASFNLGVALQELGDVPEALRWFERAVSLAPEQGMMQFRFADALWAAGESARSVGHYQAALLTMPKSVELLTDLARTLHARESFDGALAMARRALEIDARLVDAHVQLGQSLLALERLGEGLTSLRTALQLDPTNTTAQLAYSYAAFRCGRVEEVVSTLRRSLRQTSSAALHSNLVFACAFHPELDSVAILSEAKAWAGTYEKPLADRVRAHTNDRNPERKLRVAYVSPDFWDHCQALFMAPLLQAHDRGQLEVVCYASVERSDAMTELLRTRADAWHDVKALDDLALADRIRDDGIDVLIDLTMHMSGNRLRTFACRPAPVQISWLAYPGTTGLSQIDYRITDQYIDPAPDGERGGAALPRIEALPGYSERSIVLRDTFWCYEPLSTQAVSALPALDRGHVTFGCLNNLAKVNDQVLALWAKVLSAVPGSRMLLRAPAGEPRERALAAFAKAGVDGSRIQFVERVPRGAYLASYAAIDICLDTFPYNGHTTSLDAHWMGVPVVTLVGPTVVGRAGLCQAVHLGLVESLVALTPEQFVERAALLASDLPRLAALRLGLRDRLQRSPLMDAQRFARQLERAYRLAWRSWCAEAPPS